jgi:hypothetical protein
MSVHRLAKYQTDDPFTRVPNSAINDERLDLKARGLLLLMLSKPDGWTFRERHLAKVAGVGRDQLRSAMQTLIETGYVVRSKEAFDGKPPITVTRVYDVPQHAEVGLPEVGFPDRGETRPLSNKPVLVTNETTLATPTESPKSAKRDELFEAVAQACGIDWTNITPTGRGPLNKAVKELRDIGVTPDQISGRATAYRRTYPDAPLTPMALTKHWAALVPTGTTRRPSRPSCQHCDQPLDDHDQQVCETFGRFYR